MISKSANFKYNHASTRTVVVYISRSLTNTLLTTRSSEKPDDIEVNKSEPWHKELNGFAFRK